MAIETARKTSIRKIYPMVQGGGGGGWTKADNPGYIRVIDEITFIDEKMNYQEIRMTFDNSDLSSRKASLRYVYSDDREERIYVEYATKFDVMDLKKNYQETEWNEAYNEEQDVPKHLASHKVKIYEMSSPGVFNKDNFLEVTRVDQVYFMDPKNNYQETILYLKWPDDDQDIDPAEANTSYDDTAINPPWRLDPFQIITDVKWGGGAIESPGFGNYVSSGVISAPDNKKMLVSFWAKLPVIYPNQGLIWPTDNVVLSIDGDRTITQANGSTTSARHEVLIGVNSAFQGTNLNPKDLGVVIQSRMVDGGNDWTPLFFFRSGLNKITPNEWFHALIAVDMNGTNSIGHFTDTASIGANYATLDWFGTNNVVGTTTKKGQLWINGRNALSIASVGEVKDGGHLALPSPTPPDWSLSDWFSPAWDIPLNNLPFGVPHSSAYDAAFTLTSQAIDICQVQVWFGICPTINDDIITDFIDFETVGGIRKGSPAALTDAEISAYKGAGVLPANWLSKAAAPNNFDKPYFYQDGRPSKFIVNKGTGVSTTQTGTILSKPRPSNISMP